MTAAEFVAKWSRAALSERSSSQQHFLDLCELVGHPKPAEIDPTGDSFCFERGTEKHGGGDGWADVWKRGSFAFEYKGRHANLAKAFDQLLRYRASLDNPPLLVVCDTDTIEIRTNFTGTPEAVYRFTTLEIGQPRNLEILHALFHDPVRLRPGRSSEAITREAAAALASLAGSLRTRGQDAEASARFLDRIVFCLFAEDVGLLPDGIFGNILENTLTDPERFARYASELFRAMADGGEFQFKPIAHFNGGLFSDPVVPPLESSEIAAIHVAAQLDWGAVDPSIFGTLFQRGLDPSTRAALGAEYTGRADIEDLVEPVLIAPLRREWEAIQSTIRNLLATGKKNPKSGVTHKAPTGPGCILCRRASVMPLTKSSTFTPKFSPTLRNSPAGRRLGISKATGIGPQMTFWQPKKNSDGIPIMAHPIHGTKFTTTSAKGCKSPPFRHPKSERRNALSACKLWNGSGSAAPPKLGETFAGVPVGRPFVGNAKPGAAAELR